MSLEYSIYRLCLIAPVGRPIVVKRAKMTHCYGTCSLVKGKFIITIAKNLNPNIARDSLLHEWAHAMAWSEKEEHGPMWGVCYARLWSDFYD